jgi:hypothetical protein
MGVNKSGLLLQFFYELMPGIERKLSYARLSFFIDTPNNAASTDVISKKRSINKFSIQSATQANSIGNT